MSTHFSSDHNRVSLWLVAEVTFIFIISLFHVGAASGSAQHTGRRAANDAAARFAAARVADPTLQPDGTAAFRLRMPNAHSVMLTIEGKRDPIALSKGADGVWSATVPRLAPEYYSYFFTVDGVDMTDPENPNTKNSLARTQNFFLVPGERAMPWESQNVPHGMVHHHTYSSNIVGVTSDYYVYTPPGFNARSHHQKKYPVLYLLHGYSDDPSAWIELGKVNVILDNLIAARRVKPMIVVMPLAFGDMRIVSQGRAATWRDPSVRKVMACSSQDAADCFYQRVLELPQVAVILARRVTNTVLRDLRGDALVKSNYMNFDKALFEEVMPLVAQQYPVSSKREDHAIAGFSMGGAETLLVGLNHMDQFAWIGSFSAATGLESNYFEALFPAITPASAAPGQRKLKLLWIACASGDGLFDYNENFIAWLKEHGMQPTAVVTPGLHDWTVWRDNFVQFAPLLFQSKS